MNKKRQASAGFTLIEIAVVLVIIGLLLGGVLKGQELIGSAKVRSLINDARNIASAYFSYQERFRYLPGDDPNPSARVGSTAVTASTNGTLGNARVEGEWNSNTVTDESVLFWQHLRLANLTNGSTSAPNSTTLNDWLPRNAEGGRIGVTSVSPISGWSGNLFVCQDHVSGRLARMIDSGIDDTNPAEGAVRWLPDPTTTYPASAVTSSQINDSSFYIVCLVS